MLQILLLYFLARFVAVGSSPWQFLVCRSLYSMYCSVTVKSLSWQSCCSLNPLIPKFVTFFTIPDGEESEDFEGRLHLTTTSFQYLLFQLVERHLVCYQDLFAWNIFSSWTASLKLLRTNDWRFFEDFFEVEVVYCRWTRTLQKVPSSVNHCLGSRGTGNGVPGCEKHGLWWKTLGLVEYTGLSGKHGV